jgi:hypothetical protein
MQFFTLIPNLNLVWPESPFKHEIFSIEPVKKDRFRHPTRLLGTFSLSCPPKSPRQIAPVCRVFHGLQTGVGTNLDRYILP